MKLIDTFLDRITMYKLLEDYLLILVGAAMLLSVIGVMTYSPIDIAVIAGLAVAACMATNMVFARLFHVPANPESPIITGLILALIITPALSLSTLLFVVMASFLAMASKYLLTYRDKHLFNPAAIAVVITSLGAGQSASWWVGSAPLVPVVLIGGLLLVRKIRRGAMVSGFFGAVLGATVVLSLLAGNDPVSALQKTLLHSSALFLGFVMLTEPLTAPVTSRKQRWYGVLTGLLLPPQVHLFSLYSTPQLALSVGNIYSFFVSPTGRPLLRFKEKLRWGKQTYDFIFTPSTPLTYAPGQYMEWTLPHAKPDNRGSRRYFTLASSPTEDTLRLGVKFYPNGSTFKRAFMDLDDSTPIGVGQLAGDFTLPSDPTRKLAFIAGGIGVTPFRSMIKYLIDTNDARSVAMIYSERAASELAYTDVFNEAADKISAAITYTITDTAEPVPAAMHQGLITPDLIAAKIPDYRERVFYISGPHPMVSATKDMLRSLGVNDSNIKIDFFSGYA
jgi:ferredoxin-NADP reductase/Na+-translocating ferredoxin:NAD+ oxidoreductase RnfD subunit